MDHEAISKDGDLIARQLNSHFKDTRAPASIEYLNDCVGDLIATLKVLASRIADLEHAGLNYRGIWAANTKYRVGSFVTSQGSLWHAEIDSQGVKPGSGAAAWKMAVKNGEAEKLKVRPPKRAEPTVKKVTKVTAHDKQGRILEYETVEKQVDDD